MRSFLKLILLLVFTQYSVFATAQDFKIGQVTQAEGESTFLHYAPPHELKQVKSNEAVRMGGSYLTQDTAFITIEFFDGSWLRINPKSKLSIEFLPHSKQILIHLFTGSIKTLFSSKFSSEGTEKIIVKSAGTLFETVGAKFSVVRNPLTSTNSVFVEKGSVVTIQHVANERKDMEIVHTNEMTSVRDNDHDIKSPRKMSEGEVKFLHPSKYLKQTKSRF
jgi:ferric-dicitrate binding protein FerR (iron transport regulator)